jgi:7-carboxy-7-deazaguanine synthase
MLPVMELFGPTIQGEGARAGNISYFIRFGGCNFSCKGFGVKYTDPNGVEKMGCDSYYSVDQKFKKEWELLSYSEMVERMDKLITDANHHSIKPDIVITGGEPTMYWKHDEFQNFLIYYISRGHKITIETNSSLDIDFIKPYQKDIVFSMSTKLSNSGEPEHKRINIENISNILENAPDSYFKFVINGESRDEVTEEIEGILKEVPWYANVYLMPMGETTETINKNALKCAELAIEKGWKYSDRLHIRIWEDKPGV